MKTVALLIAYVVSTVGVVVYFVGSNAYVLTCLWTWFLVPMRVPPITMLQAVGITCIVDLLATSDFRKIEDTDRNEYLLKAAVKPWFLLLVGFIAKSLM